MGRLSGFNYREVAKRLRALGFAFDRQAAGSHKIWYNAAANRYTSLPNHPAQPPRRPARGHLARHPQTGGD